MVSSIEILYDGRRLTWNAVAPNGLNSNGVVYDHCKLYRITGSSTLMCCHIAVEREVVAQNYMLMVFRKVAHTVIINLRCKIKSTNNW